MPAEIARRVNLKLDSKPADGEEEEDDEKAKFTLGKQDLTKYFKEKERSHAR